MSRPSNGRPAMSKRTAIILRSHARVIQRLGRRAVSDIVEIGRWLDDAKRRLGHITRSSRPERSGRAQP